MEVQESLMTIQFSGLHVDAALRTRITDAVNETVTRIRTAALPAHVVFTDDDGPKNGPAIRCAITIRLPRHRAIHVERVDATKRSAFDLAHAALTRQVHDEAERLRDARRRPKKYFAARRALTPPLTKKG